jgi:hypothetical protein
MIEKVVEVAGRQAAVNLYRRAQAVERDGGMLVEKGNRRRTPGGLSCFL